MVLQHNRAFIDSTQAERLAARGPLSADAGGLERMVLAASEGDTAAWSSLMHRFTARLRAVVRAHRLAAKDVEDVVQTTWLRLLEHIDGLRDPCAIGAWLEATARRESLRVLRATQRECPTDSVPLAPEPVAAVAERRLVASHDRAALTQAIVGLPHRQRRLLVMLFADPPASYDAISRTLDMPVGSIGPTRARILDRLRGDPVLVAAVGHRAGQ
jgi:RNA polymerase sigma factor (sigma-70 family)